MPLVVSLLDREEERRSLDEPDTPCSGGEGETVLRLAAAAAPAECALLAEAPLPPSALKRNFSDGMERGRSELLRLRPTSQSKGS